MDSKVWYLSKTIWKEVVLVLIAVLTLLSVLPINESTLAIIVVVLGLLGIALRFLTGLPITITQIKETISPDADEENEQVLDDIEKENSGNPPAPLEKP